MTPSQRTQTLESLARLDRIFRERGCTTAMVTEARQLADELEIDPPSWAGGANGYETRAPRESTGGAWHQAKRYETLRGEWERWRYQRSKFRPVVEKLRRERPTDPDELKDWQERFAKLPAAARVDRMMEPGQRQCRRCEGFFEPATLRQRHCSDTCRKLAHKSKTTQPTD